MAEHGNLHQQYRSYRQTLHEIAESPQLVKSVDSSKRFQQYVRSADVLLQQIRIYRRQHDYELLYMFLHRLYVHLLLLLVVGC